MYVSVVIIFFLISLGLFSLFLLSPSLFWMLHVFVLNLTISCVAFLIVLCRKSPWKDFLCSLFLFLSLHSHLRWFPVRLSPLHCTVIATNGSIFFFTILIKSGGIHYTNYYLKLFYTLFKWYEYIMFIL